MATQIEELDEADVVAARESWVYFGVLATHGFWKPYQHILVMEPYLRRLASREHPLRRIMFTLPPQHGKSQSVSQVFATWMLGHAPDRNVGIGCASSALAQEFGGYNRDMMAEWGPKVFDVHVNPRSKSKQHWKILGRRGGMRSVGRGGQLSGFRVDHLAIDDLYKDYEEAQSPVIRVAAKNWYTSTARTRLAKGATMSICNTRWHEDDLIGHILQTEQVTTIGSEALTSTSTTEAVSAATEELAWHDKREAWQEHWYLLNFTDIAEQDEWIESRLFRRQGEALCPELHPLDELRAQQRILGAYQYGCLYRQRPMQAEGTMWSPALFGPQIWVERWPTKLEVLVLAIDPSMGKDKARGDYASLCAMGIRGDGVDTRIYKEYRLERATPKQIVQMTIDLCKDLPREPDVIGCESVAFSEIICDLLTPELLRNGIGSPAVAIRSDNAAKELRIQRLDRWLQTNAFAWIDNPHGRTAAAQFRNFPHPSAHDDAPDSCEMATRLLQSL